MTGAPIPAMMTAVRDDPIDLVEFQAAQATTVAVWAALGADDDDALKDLVAPGLAGLTAAELRDQLQVSAADAAAMKPVGRYHVFADGCLGFEGAPDATLKDRRPLRPGDRRMYLVVQRHADRWRLSDETKSAFGEACEVAIRDVVQLVPAAQAYLGAIVTRSLGVRDEGAYLTDFAQACLGRLPATYRQEPALREYGLMLEAIVATRGGIDAGDPMPLASAIDPASMTSTVERLAEAAAAHQHDLATAATRSYSQLPDQLN